ncbi:MAG TPA: glutaredoxin [Bacteroidetes bacterium]|nr:glutaredoxin [Bacteroidota bacterium]
MQIVNSGSVLFYNGTDSLGKKTYAYAKSQGEKMNFQDLNLASLSSTTLQVILHALKISAKDLINRADPRYQAQWRGKELDDDAWLNVLKKNPYLIKWPILFHNGNVYLCQTPNDVFKK